MDLGVAIDGLVLVAIQDQHEWQPKSNWGVLLIVQEK